jgi:hypothetical protein
VLLITTCLHRLVFSSVFASFMAVATLLRRPKSVLFAICYSAACFLYWARVRVEGVNQQDVVEAVRQMCLTAVGCEKRVSTYCFIVLLSWAVKLSHFLFMHIGRKCFFCLCMLAPACSILRVSLLLSFLPWGALLWTDYLDFHAFIRRP